MVVKFVLVQKTDSYDVVVTCVASHIAILDYVPHKNKITSFFGNPLVISLRFRPWSDQRLMVAICATIFKLKSV